MNNYYLIVRYKDNNEVKAIGINSRWYLDVRTDDSFSKRNTLEAIDLVTSRFKNKEEMLNRMYKNGYIRSSSADVFIARKRRHNGKEFLKIYEAIYNPKNDNRIKEFRDIAKSSLQKNINSEREKVKTVFDKIASKAFYDKDFSSYLKSNFTNIYKELVEAYAYSSDNLKPAYNVKYDKYWTLSSYNVIRNMIEALNRFDLFVDSNDKVDANISFLNENGIDRKKVEKELLEKTDINYIEGQYSLFDMNIDKNNTLNTKNDNDTFVKSENLSVTQKNIEKEDLSISKKKKFVIDTIKKIPSRVFGHGANGEVVKEQYFDYYPSDDDKKKFLSLPSLIINVVYLYILHYEMYKEALRLDRDTLSLEVELRNDKSRLDKLFKKNNNIDKCYQWCLTYLKCLEYENMIIDQEDYFDKFGGDVRKVGK